MFPNILHSAHYLNGNKYLCYQINFHRLLNYFNKLFASTQIVKYSYIGLVILALSIVIVLGQLTVAIGLILLPFVIAYLFILFKYPVAGIYTCLFFAFTANGIVRYIPVTLGLSIDFFLTLTWIAVFFTRFESKNWQDLKNPVLIFALLWTIYCVFEIFNPQVVSYEAWVYAVRSPAFYLIMALSLGLLLLKERKDLFRIVHIWLGFSLIGALYSIKQFIFGLDTAELQWLALNASTHMLFGNLRVFSFYSDAAQFGSAMAHAGIVAIILSLGKFSWQKRGIYLICSCICLYGMAISGTRGALFILFAGLFSYFILNKNFKILVIGISLSGAAFGLLKFTYIGHSNYQIQRMRSAFNLQDPSFQVRIKNQLKLKEYLDSRPFGGGIGSAGYWGLRFNPDTFLAKTPTDSWYVKIWAETGIVGLAIYLAMVLFILVYLGTRLWKQQDSTQTQFLLALFAGLVGISVANYGNQVVGQMPTALLFYLSIALIYNFTTPPQAGHVLKNNM